MPNTPPNTGFLGPLSNRGQTPWAHLLVGWGVVLCLGGSLVVGFSGCDAAALAASDPPSLLAHLPIGPWKTEHEWKLAMTQGYQAYETEAYRQAQQYFLHAETLATTGKLNANKQAATLNQLGLTECMLGQYSRAESHTQKALAMVEDEATPSPVNLGIGYNNLGLIADYRGDRESAKTYYRHALKQLQQSNPISPNSNPRNKTKGTAANTALITQTLLNLAGVYTEEGAYAKALPLLKKAYQLTPAKQSPTAAAILARLSHVQFAQGNTHKALLAIQQAEAIYQKTLPPHHPRLNELAEQRTQMEALDTPPQATTDEELLQQLSQGKQGETSAL